MRACVRACVRASARIHVYIIGVRTGESVRPVPNIRGEHMTIMCMLSPVSYKILL